MKLVETYGGLGRYELNTSEQKEWDALFKTLAEHSSTGNPNTRSNQLGELVHLLFTDINPKVSDIGTCTAYRRGLIPYRHTGEGQQIITPVEPSRMGLQHFPTMELRLITAETGKFATIALPGYRLSTIDDLATMICKRTHAKEKRIEGVLQIPQDRQQREYGIAAVVSVKAVLNAYDKSEKLLNNAPKHVGLTKKQFDVLRRGKKSTVGHVRILTTKMYDAALEELAGHAMLIDEHTTD